MIDLMIVTCLKVIDKLASCRVMVAVFVLIPANENQLNQSTTAESHRFKGAGSRVNPRDNVVVLKLVDRVNPP